MRKLKELVVRTNECFAPDGQRYMGYTLGNELLLNLFFDPTGDFASTIYFPILQRSVIPVAYPPP
jgi:hypothetical protein